MLQFVNTLHATTRWWRTLSFFSSLKIIAGGAVMQLRARITRENWNYVKRPKLKQVASLVCVED